MFCNNPTDDIQPSDLSDKKGQEDVKLTAKQAVVKVEREIKVLLLGGLPSLIGSDIPVKYAYPTLIRQCYLIHSHDVETQSSARESKHLWKRADLYNVVQECFKREAADVAVPPFDQIKELRFRSETDLFPNTGQNAGIVTKHWITWKMASADLHEASTSDGPAPMPCSARLEGEVEVRDLKSLEQLSSWPILGTEIVKTRYFVGIPDTNLIAEIDDYGRQHKGLVTLEVEFDPDDGSGWEWTPERVMYWIEQTFGDPGNAGNLLNVSADKAYKNYQLAVGRADQFMLPHLTCISSVQK
jgi:hypothetical protein